MVSSDSNLVAKNHQDLQVAQFVLFCGNLVWIIIGSILSGIALCVALREQLSLEVRVTWFAGIASVNLLRTGLLHYWNKHATTVANVKHRIVVATVLSTIVASGFGLIAFLAVTEESPLINLLVVMVLTGMVASATVSISLLLPMYLLSIFPIMLPAAVRLSSFNDVVYHWLAGLIVVYLIVCLGTSRSIRASIMHSISLRFDNLILLDNLRQEKRRTDVALKREEQANQAKSKFLAAASHDLRQPLHSLRLFTATLEHQTRDTKHKSLVAKIDSSAKSLEDLFNALLDISKLDAGTFSVEKQHVYLDILLSQIEGEFAPLAEQKRLALNVELADHIVHTDPILLERLIRNLVSNAIRYTDKGSITLSTTIEGNSVYISISDTGVGIPVADQARVFEEFVQLGNVERDRSQGIGLGLSIVQRLSTILDVDIQVQSLPGKGSTFAVCVPLGDPLQCRFTPRMNSLTGASVDSLFVLVIDDEEEVCLAVEGLLETWGCVVMTANSGDAALQQLEEIGEVPDVLLSDYRLRDGENGGDVILRIREFLNSDIPGIILTGDIAPDRLVAIKALGFPMLHKPCEPADLRQLLAKAVLPDHSDEIHEVTG